MTGHQLPYSKEHAKQSTRGQNKRSRTGCLACLQSKVKCDESHPICKRCDRTKKQCVWPEVRPTLRARRRGHGPYKDRTTRNLHPIVPASQSPEPNTGDAGTSSIAVCTKPSDDRNTMIAPYTEPLEISDFSRWLACGDFESYDTSTTRNELELDAMLLAEEGSQNPLLNCWIHQQYNQDSSIPYALQSTHIPSSSSVTIGQPEWEALQFFERVFATIYSPKPFTWSYCAILAQYGKNHGAIQHLIIAVCLCQLDKISNNESFWRLGKSHYQAGAQLIMQEMHHTQLDHCKVFMAFWLLQATYNIYWSDKAATSLAKLSQAMAEYTRKNQLLKLFSKSSAFKKSQEVGMVTTKRERSLLARLMIFSLYEDIDAEFCHAGGFFAAEVCADNTIKDVYNAGRNFLSDFFETIYPQDELLDDIQRSNLLDLHFEANLRLHMINQTSRNSPSRELFEEIANQLEDLKSQHSAAFQLTQIENLENNKVLSSANNIIAHFLAVETYNFQCLQSHVQDLTYTTRLHFTIQELLRIIGNLSREWPMNMPYRNQWLYFIASTGTSDAIHVAWIIDRLKLGRYFQTLRRTIDIQRASKVQMSIDDIRSLFWGLGNELLPANEK